MDTDSPKPDSNSQDSNDPGSNGDSKLPAKNIGTPDTPTTIGFKLKPSSKGVENAKKRLRAFSIQKKTPVTPVVITKSAVAGTGSSTIFIGKLSGVKTTPKTEDAEPKKLPPKPPKPGQSKKTMESYTELQKRRLSEIEDMKRKMELVELGIPLGLICPTSTSDKAMPTKAMPPIESLLDPAKLDEIISEAKKAKAEGKEFKFDYQKLLPAYDNPFQRKKEDVEEVKKDQEHYKKIEKDKRMAAMKGNRFDRGERFDRDSRRHNFHRKDDRNRRKPENERARYNKGEWQKSAEKETDVNLSDYLVCDSWSLDNEEKTNSSSPKPTEPAQADNKNTPSDVKEKSVEPPVAVTPKPIEIVLESPKTTPVRKIEKLQPVMDSFKYEIDSNDDEVIDIFDENSDIERYNRVTHKKEDYDSPYNKIFDELDQTSKDASMDAVTEDTFLESVINEIKQEEMTDDDQSNDKGLVEYDSPSRDSYSPKGDRISVTPELDDKMRDLQSSRSDYSDGYRSTESGYKSTESGYKSNTSYKSDNRSDSYRMSVENDMDSRMLKSTVVSLETWSFVLKICQPLLFRHDRNKCYRESRTLPKIWYTENPKLCSCVRDRAIVYEELEACKMNLVDRVYGCDQIPETESPKLRAWYPRFAHCLAETNTVVSTSTEWEADDSQTETPVVKDKGSYKSNRSTTPIKNEEVYLDREYQRFMEAVWPEVSEAKSGTPRSTTPVKQEARKKKAEEHSEDKKKSKKLKLSSEGWSQESDVDEEEEKRKKIEKIHKAEKKADKVRKRKLSSSISDSDSDKKRKKSNKKKANKKVKTKITKRRRISKKYLKKLKEKQRKKKKQASEDEDAEKEKEKEKRRQKKLKKKKLQKKKKAQKKKAKVKSSSSSSSTSSSTESTTTDSETEIKKKKKKKSQLKQKTRSRSSSESSQSEELFDVNILNNIKTERLTDDEKKLEFSPRKQKPREIINVKELQNDFVDSVQIKKEVIEKEKEVISVQDLNTEEKEFCTETVVQKVPEIESKVPETVPPLEQKLIAEKEKPIPKVIEESIIPEIVKESLVESSTENIPMPECISDGILLENIPVPKDDSHFKEPTEISRLTSQDRTDAPLPEESNLSQCSSQDSTTSKDPYEKDDSHLRPSSQNSNYSFHDVINASQNYQKDDEENYEQGNYEMYEQLAMAYQSDVAKQGVFQSSPSTGEERWVSQRIETVVRARSLGEIKCDWRPGDNLTTSGNTQQRPSRWGLKPGEVNIVLTGGNNEQYPIPNVVEPVYQIQSLANNRENNSTGSYDEAYEDMYGASDRLQYGDCFSVEVEGTAPSIEDKKITMTSSSLDERINRALKTTILGDITNTEQTAEQDKDGPEKGILMTKSEARNSKRVSFADGYKPGQDSDVEEPPKRKKKTRRNGCAWPCPATHPDHVPLWDALPPPPPPPGSPPPPFGQPPPIIPAMMMQQPPPMMQQPPPMLQQQQMIQQQQMLQQQGINPAMMQAPFGMGQKMDPSSSLPNFMPPEPPPGLISFQ